MFRRHGEIPPAPRFGKIAQNENEPSGFERGYTGMKWFLNRCRRHRRSICLLAGSALSEPEMNELRVHLANCADCRKYHDEMVSLAKPLADWETNFARVKPSPETQSRWAKAIQAAADVNRREQPVREWTFTVTLANVVRLSFRELIWPCRRIWMGLAAVWVIILAVNFSAHDAELVAAGNQLRRRRK